MLEVKQISALRAKYGADSQIGWYCSNLIEQLKNYPDLPQDAKPRMEKLIAASVVRLAKVTTLNADDGGTL